MSWLEVAKTVAAWAAALIDHFFRSTYVLRILQELKVVDEYTAVGLRRALDLLS